MTWNLAEWKGTLYLVSYNNGIFEGRDKSARDMEFWWRDLVSDVWLLVKIVFVDRSTVEGHWDTKECLQDNF